ncbi:hypothetical protein CAPTEDRAFT_209661 [Capitella teleta]|uniref:Uncharacterized protein n=1 Tax=Capitella teleta TaxID=283909 RepID=R7VH25_CAPTE|nr:hypothetical protein CAPTEDRAFT_209661 [Capitella teleta]|eukprot:ELU15601.1 hypothetical protein CAPTEDRAFT_209661 [Capitella teleta]
MQHLKGKKLNVKRIAVNLVDIHYQVIKTFHTLGRLEGDWAGNMADPPNNLSALTLDGIDHKASEDEEMPLFIPKIDSQTFLDEEQQAQLKVKQIYLKLSWISCA